MSELVTTRIGTHAARLGLPHLAAAAPALIQRAHDAQLGYADFLDLILGEEAAAKDDRRFASALHVSGLPHHKTLDDFDFTFQPDLDIRKIKDLRDPRLHRPDRQHRAAGPAGHGQDAPGLRPGRRRLRGPQIGLLHHPGRHDPQAAGCRRRLLLGRQLRGYLRSSILIVDEVGYLPLNRHDANLVFQIIARRYEKGSVIITSNKTFSEWGQVFTDDVLATAILDRFLHHCEVITINGPSWRMSERQKPHHRHQPAHAIINPPGSRQTSTSGRTPTDT